MVPAAPSARPSTTPAAPACEAKSFSPRSVPSSLPMEAFVEMGGGADDEDEHEQELEVMPDLFARIRPLLMNADGESRMTVRAGTYMSFFMAVAMPRKYTSL